MKEFEPFAVVNKLKSPPQDQMAPQGVAAQQIVAPPSLAIGYQQTSAVNCRMTDSTMSECIATRCNKTPRDKIEGKVLYFEFRGRAQL